MLHADADLLTSGGTSYPPIDPIGPGAQWGHYTDEETRGDGSTTGLALIGDSYYDASTGRFLTRGGAGVNEYAAGGWSGLDTFQTVLDVIGWVPGLGELADVASGVVDLARGDFVGAGLSLGSLSPVGGQAAGGAKIARRLARRAQKAAERVGNVSAIRGAKQLSLDFGAGTVGRNPRLYTVAYEMKLPAEAYPIEEATLHHRLANRALLDAMDADAEFAAAMEDLIPNLRQQIRAPRAPGLPGPPEGWVWHHHPVRVGVMQLVPKAEHTQRSPLWYIMHPGGRGGWANWGRKRAR